MAQTPCITWFWGPKTFQYESLEPWGKTVVQQQMLSGVVTIAQVHAVGYGGGRDRRATLALTSVWQ